MAPESKCPFDRDSLKALGTVSETSGGRVLQAYMAMLRQRHAEACYYRSGDELLRAQGAVQVLDEIAATLKRLGTVQ